MKIAKKSLSVFLALLMIFSACSVGLTGIIASAAELPALLDEDGSYTADEVRAYLAKAAAEYDASGLVNANNTLTYEGNYSMLLAADAVISYALKNYNTGFGGRIANNTGETLAGALVSGLGITDGIQQGIVYAILDPAGTRVFSYWGSLPKPNSDKEDSSKYAWHSGTIVYTSNNEGKEITDHEKVEWKSDGKDGENLNDFVEQITKTTSISVDAAGLNNYLLTFDSVASVPKKIPTRIQFSFDYGAEKYAYCYKYTNALVYNEAKYVAYKWNYFTNVKSSIRAKETKVKKQLENFVEYFTPDVLSLTFDEMLEMSAADLYNYYLVAQGKVDTAVAANLSDAVLDHFLQTDAGCTYADVKAYIANLYEAYLIVLGKGSIDVLFNDIGTDYSDMSYAEMSELYASVSTAYDVVVDIDKDILNFIITNYEGYAEKYNSVTAALADAKAYIDELYAAMRIQHIKELRENMIDMYNEYYDIAADTNNLEDIDTTQLTAVVDKANGINETLKNYTAAEIAQVISADERTAWDDFCAKLDAKLAVRDDEAAYDSFFDYFFPYLFQDYTGMSNEELMDLHANAGTELEKLRTIYGEFVAQYGQEWTNALFTVTYNGETGLLHDLVNKNYAASNSALANYMTALNSAQLATIAAYAGLTTVDFTNYADLRSTLKHFDDAFYTYCLEQGLVSSSDAAVYATIETLLASWKAFVSTSGESAFNHNFTYADSNGVYADRYAGDQTVEVPDGEGGTNEVQIGYPNDIARDNEDKNSDGIADDNYTVTEDEITETIVKIDNFITSRDFASIIGLKDLISQLSDLGITIDEKDAESIVDLASFVNVLFESAFTDDLMNTLISAVYPMITELIETELVNVISELGEKTEQNASGAYNIEVDLSVFGTLTGTVNIYLDQDLYDHHGELKLLQHQFPQLFADLGLYIYPSTFATFLSEWDPAMFGPTTDVYKALTAAGRDWSKLVAEDDPETKEDESKKLDFEWGVYDSESFISGLGMIIDSILPLAQTALGVDRLDVTAGDAAFIHGEVKLWGVGHSLGAIGELTLTCESLNAYQKILVPLFEALKLDDYGYVLPTIRAGADGEEIASAIVEPILELLNQILANPLTKILEILPNLIYFLSMDSVSEMLGGLALNLVLNVSDVDIKTEYSGLIGDIASVAEGALGGLIEFPLELNLGELLDLDEMLDFNLTDLNDIIQTLVGDEMNLPRLDQTTIMFASDWVNTTSANGSPRVNLKANKVDVLYAILSYAVSALGTEGFLEGLLGDDIDPAIKEIINRVASNVLYNMDGAIAAIMEILVPNTDANGEPEYELEEMDWIKQGAFDYNGIAGADQMSIVYLNYGNDWTKADSQYIIENVDAIVATILEMTGSDIESLNTYLADMVNDIFTGDIITDLIKMLGGLGDSPSEFIDDIVSQQIGLDITVWFDAFGYLFPAETWKEDAVVIAPGEAGYTTTFANVTASADAEGNITWYYAGEAFEDGDKTAFVNILCELLAEFDVAVGLLLGGWDVSAFDSLVEIKGYESYASTFGVLLETLGVENLPSQADFSAAPIDGLKKVLVAIVDWFDALVASDNMIETVLELIPDLFYYIESNGLGTLIHNLLMPVLVIVDDIRPLLDVNLNGILSLIVSEFVNYGEIDFNVVLQYLSGAYMNDDLDYKWCSVDLNKLTLSEILKIADAYLGTDLYNSGFAQIGLKGLCSGIEPYDSVAGAGYKTTVDAADTLTILLTAVIDCLSYPAQDKSKTNGDVVLEFIADMTGNEDIAGMYTMIAEVIAGLEYEYAFPNWGYMFPEGSTFTLDLPEHTIVYLGYNTDWDKETANSVYDSLDEILNLVLDSTLEEGETLKTLIDGLLTDNVYTDENLTAIVELIVNALADFDTILTDLVDAVVSTNISAWFQFCEEVTDEETGETEWVCTYDWGVDEKETAAEKKDAFVAGIKAVLAPANELLAWLFFGGSYEFFTASAKDKNGDYTYESLITLNGGEGYAYGLVPILEALGCEMQPAENFYDAATDTYNAGDAIGALLDSVLALADKIAANPIEEVFTLLPNLIYFINADGIKTSVNNLLAPVNGIIEKLSAVVGEVSIGALLADAIGFDICDISMDALLKLAADNGVVINDEITTILKTFYIGALEEFESANGYDAYRLVYTEEENAADMVTIVLSLALDIFNDNEVLFSDLLGADVYTAVKNLIANTSSEFTYQTIDWAYMYEGVELADRLEALVAAGGVLPERPSDVYETYTKYQNNWNEATVDYLDSILEEVADEIAASVAGTDSSIGDLIEGLLADNVYSDDVINSLLEMVVELLVDYEDIIAKAGALLGAEGIADWFDYCEITTDEDGETVVTCTKNWGIDDAADEDKKDAFVNAFVTALEPANRLLAWLLFGEDYTFFNGTTNDVLITLNGGEGYTYALVPLFEALGVNMPAASELEDTSAAVAVIAGAVSDILDLYCDNTVDAVLNLVPNLIYFLNAGGVSTVINNLLVPVNGILDALTAFGVELDLASLIEGFDITNITTEALLDMLVNELGIVIPADLAEFIKTFYIGKLVSTGSGYRLAYTEEETRGDMITILLSIVLEVFAYEDNEEVFADMLGEDIYFAIMKVLDLEGAKEMQDYEWIYTEYADTDKEFNAVDSSVRYTAAYNNIWTRDKAEYIADNLISFVSNILGLIGLEINGIEIKSLDDLLDSLLEGNLYTQSIADTLLDTLKGLPDMLEDLEPYGDYVVGILKNALGVDLGAWENMTVTVVDGNRDSFIAAIEKMLAPVVPLLNVLLCGEDISFFYNIEGKDVITIYGSEGYAYGIIPVFEALGCTMMTPDEFYALDNEAKIGAIIEALLDRVDVILADPVNEIFGMLPEIIYFINSNGLDAAVNNILNSVDTVLACLEPLVGATSLMELLDVELAKFDFEYLINMAAEAVEESTGLGIETLVIDFVSELTMGKVVSYQSANGETYYKMVYAGKNQFADMITILLRLAIDFLATGNNAEAIIALIAGNSESEDAANSASTLVNFILTGLNTEPATSGAMAVLYYIFYGLNHGVEGLDYLYGNYGKSWDALVAFFEDNDDSFVNKAANVLKAILKEFAGIDTDSNVDHCDCNCHNKSAFIRFFFKIANFFRKLFGMKQYRYCDCGAAHW